MLFISQAIAIATIWLKIMLLMPKYPAIEMACKALEVLKTTVLKSLAAAVQLRPLATIIPKDLSQSA